MSFGHSHRSGHIRAFVGAIGLMESQRVSAALHVINLLRLESIVVDRYGHLEQYLDLNR